MPGRWREPVSTKDLSAMKIAVLSDVHANFLALEAVIRHLDGWRPDHIAVAGDIVNRGPSPIECLALVQEKVRLDDWRLVQGNHEEYVINQAVPDAPRSGPAFELLRHSFWTYQQLNGHMADLEKMPFLISIAGPDRREIRVVHASMRDNRDGIFPETTDQELRRKIEPAPAVLAVGHTHQPLVRQVDQTLVVNAGSVGAPFDGDRRASYAQLTWHDGRWQAEIIRVTYDLQRAEQAFFDSGYLDEAGPVARLMMAEFQKAKPHMYTWYCLYEEPILAGRMTVDAAVEEFLAR
jgi:predicted phosphodiesterase